MSSSRYAGLVTRVGALTVDVGVLTLAVLATGSLPSLAWNQVVGAPPEWLTTGEAIVAAVLPFAYFTSCWYLGGASIGGLLFGVVVRRGDGAAVPLLRAAVRAGVGLLLAPLWLAGLAVILVDPRRRALHDRVFGTVVCYRRP